MDASPYSGEVREKIHSKLRCGLVRLRQAGVLVKHPSIHFLLLSPASLSWSTTDKVNSDSLSVLPNSFARHARMELIFAFCISVFFVSSRGMEVSNSVRKYNTQSCRFCSNHCNKPHDGSSENDTVKVFKPADRANTIFCLSPYEMKLVVGVESNRIARVRTHVILYGVLLAAM